MRVLIIDDEEFVRLVLERALQEEGCDVAAVTNGQAGIQALRTGTFDCVITDLRMPGIDGRAVLAWVKDHQPDVDVLLLTGHGDVKDAVDAIKQGAWDFLLKDTPFDAAAVTAALAKLHTVKSLRRENLAARHGGYRHPVVVEGSSEAWRTLKAQILKVAPSETPVLIQGETGTGKELVARLLHDLSPRSSGPLIAINCGAVSRELLESELFGHDKGAFTGAAVAKAGLLAAAEGGTLFLDELGEMPPPMQVSLLRVLDNGEYRAVGSTRTLQADVRVVGATNQELQTLVSEGRFRNDLFYRLTAVTLLVPPLRERTDDLPHLVEHILRTLRVPGAGKRSMAPDALRELAAYRWPGNIRELRNLIERVVLMNPETVRIARQDIVRMLCPAGGAAPSDDPLHQSLDEIERRHVERVLAACGGNKTQAAKVLQIDYKTLLTKLKQYHQGPAGH